MKITQGERDIKRGLVKTAEMNWENGKVGKIVDACEDCRLTQNLFQFYFVKIVQVKWEEKGIFKKGVLKTAEM